MSKDLNKLWEKYRKTMEKSDAKGYKLSVKSVMMYESFDEYKMAYNEIKSIKKGINPPKAWANIPVENILINQRFEAGTFKQTEFLVGEAKKLVNNLGAAEKAAIMRQYGAIFNATDEDWRRAVTTNGPLIELLRGNRSRNSLGLIGILYQSYGLSVGNS